MKRVIFVIVTTICHPCLALNFMGPPATIEKGLGLGIEYSYSNVDVELSGYGISGTIETEANSFFAKFLFGIADDAELSAKLGLSKIDEEASGGFSSGNEFAFGLGSRLTLSESEKMDFGALFQFATFTGDDTWVLGPYFGDMNIDIYEFQFAIGPTFKQDNINIYCGPFLHYITGDFELAGLKFDIEQESEFGGYIGMAAKFTNTSSLAVEYQLTSDAYAFGISFIQFFGEKVKSHENRSGPKIQIDEPGKKIKGYRATINPVTGKPEKTPIYEENEK